MLLKNGDFFRLELNDFYLAYSKSAYRTNFGLYSYTNESYNHNFINTIFQVIEKKNDATYPVGNPIHTDSKKLRTPNSMEKFLIKSFVTGDYLGYTEEEMEEDRDAIDEKIIHQPFFSLVNNNLKDEKSLLTKNSRVSLELIKNPQELGQYYSEGEIENYSLVQYDCNTRYYIGFNNMDDKLRPNLRTVKKNIKLQHGNGSFFRVIHVNQDEMKRILEIESISNQFNRFYKLITRVLSDDLSLAKANFGVEISNFERCCNTLDELFTQDENYATLAREFNILDTASRLCFHFLADDNNTKLFENLQHDEVSANKIARVSKSLCEVILRAANISELTHVYLSQYVRVYINSLLKPSVLLSKCDAHYVKEIKDQVIIVLKKFLWDRDLDTLGQLNYYSQEIFANLDANSSLSVHLLELLDHFMRSQAPNLVNTLRDEFIQEYSSAKERISKIFPKLEFNKASSEVIVYFQDSTSYRVSDAPAEVIKYLMWSFTLIDSISAAKNLKFMIQIMEYYPYDLCLSIVTGNSVPPKLRNKMLNTMNSIHIKYDKIIIQDTPTNLCFILEGQALKKIQESFSKILSDSKNDILDSTELQSLEKVNIRRNTSKDNDLLSLSLEILKTENAKLVQGDLNSLEFSLDVMNTILSTDGFVSEKILASLHFTICSIIKFASKEIELGVQNDITRIFKKQAEKIYYVLSLIDNHIIRYIFKETINELKDKMIQSHSVVKLHAKGDSLTWADGVTLSVLQKAIFDIIIEKMSSEWKSKKRIYEKAERVDKEDIFLEEDLLKSLWIIVQHSDLALSQITIRQIKKEINFEQHLIKQLSDSVLLVDEKDANDFVLLCSNLLKLEKMERKLKANRQLLDNPEKMSENIIDDMIAILKHFLSIAYDLKKHLGIQGEGLNQIELYELFFRIYSDSKCGKRKEVPFELNPDCINYQYQNLFCVLHAHEVLVPLIRYLVYNEDTFVEISDKKKYIMAVSLIMVIVRIALHKNTNNQLVFSRYNEFITLYYDATVLNFNTESPLMFSEMCAKNKKLLRLDEDYLLAITGYTFLAEIEKHDLNDEQAISFFKSLNFLLSAKIPNDMFNSAITMKKLFLNALSFSEKDRTLNVTAILESYQLSGIYDTSSSIIKGKKIIDVSLSYSILYQFLNALNTYATTIDKSGYVIMNEVLNSNNLLKFVCFKNIQFNFEIKCLVLRAFYNFYFNNLQRSSSLFTEYQDCLQFSAILLVDISEWLKFESYSQSKQPSHTLIHKIPFLQTVDGIIEYLMNYEELNRYDPKNTGFLVFQDIKMFSALRKEYIYFIICDLFGKLATENMEFIIKTKDKSSENFKNLFSVWLHYAVALYELETDQIYQERIVNTFKLVLCHPEYSTYRNLVSPIIGQSESLTISKRTVNKKSAEKNFEIKMIIESFLGQRREYKAKYQSVNLAEMAVFISKNTTYLSKLVELLSSNANVRIKDVIFVMRVIRAVIEVQNKRSNNKDINEWEEVSQSDIKRIIQVQNILDGLDISSSILKLIPILEKNQEAFKELLLLGIAVLYGGNKKMQDSFYQIFKNDAENELMTILSYALEKNLDILRITETRRVDKLYMKALQFFYSYVAYKKIDLKPDEIIPEDIRNDMALLFDESLEENEKNLALSIEKYEIIQLILKFFQSLCEGHNLQFQEFLRDQILAGHSKSVNIIQILRSYFESYYKCIHLENIGAGKMILDVLIEMMQGESEANVDELLQNTFINNICNILYAYNNNLDLLPRGFKLDSSYQPFIELKAKCLIIIKCIMERLDSSQIGRIKQNIDVNAFIELFKSNLITFHKSKGKYAGRKVLLIEDMWNNNLSICFSIYFILKYLSHEDNISGEFSSEISNLLFEKVCNGEGISEKLGIKYLNKFFKRYTGSIEIFKKDTKKVVKVYFPVNVMMDYLSEDFRVEFLDKVDRSNTQTKLTSLMDSADEMISQMKLNFSSRNRLLGLNFNTFYSWLRLLSNLLAISIAILNVFSLQFNNGWSFASTDDDRTQRVLNVLNSIISFFLTLLWLQNRLNGYLSACWDSKVNQFVKANGELPQSIISNMDSGQRPDKEMGKQILQYKGPYSEEYQYVEDIMSNKLHYQNMIFTIQSPELLWHIMYFGICIGSIFHPLVVSFQLFDVLFRSDTVFRIYGAVSRNKNQFLWTLILLLVTIYFYTMIGFFFLNDRFFSSDLNQNMCQDAYSCYLNTLNQGLRSGGGIADVLTKSNYQNMNKLEFFGQVVYDLTFFIIMITLLLNLIFGMIIDAFGDLRDEKTKNEEDKLNVCYICGIERGHYERTANFDVHINEEHDPWNYLAYIVFLLEKDKYYPTELTDIESYVLENFKKGDNSWMPIGRSLVLETNQIISEREKESEIEEMKNEMMNAIRKLREETTDMNENFKEIKAQIGKLLNNNKPANIQQGIITDKSNRA